MFIRIFSFLSSGLPLISDQMFLSKIFDFVEICFSCLPTLNHGLVSKLSCQLCHFKRLYEDFDYF